MLDPRGLLPGESTRLSTGDRAAWDDATTRLDQGLEALQDKPEETTGATLRALWHLAAGDPLSTRTSSLRALPSLGSGQREALDRLVTRRLSGEPLAYLTQRQSFMEIDMIAGPGALIPRAETEILATASIGVLHRLTGNPRLVIVDVCTGSGNVAAALALADPNAVVYAADLSEEAVALARRNMEFLGLSGRVDVRVGDLLAPFADDPSLGLVDLLTCNPPYISSGRVTEMPPEISAHEPPMAFDGGPLGIGILQRLIREAPPLMRPGGWLAFEVGAGQGPAVEHRLRRSADFDEVKGVSDARGEIRALLAQRKADL
jgi:release factor glutamine methyltransferase